MALYCYAQTLQCQVDCVLHCLSCWCWLLWLTYSGLFAVFDECRDCICYSMCISKTPHTTVHNQQHTHTCSIWLRPTEYTNRVANNQRCELQMWTYAGSNTWTFLIALTLCSASFCYICIGYVVLPSPLAMVQPLQALECETEREWNFVIQYTCFNTFVT